MAPGEQAADFGLQKSGAARPRRLVRLAGVGRETKERQASSSSSSSVGGSTAHRLSDPTTSRSSLISPVVRTRRRKTVRKLPRRQLRPGRAGTAHDVGFGSSSGLSNSHSSSSGGGSSGLSDGGSDNKYKQTGRPASASLHPAKPSKCPARSALSNASEKVSRQPACQSDGHMPSVSGAWEGGSTTRPSPGVSAGPADRQADILAAAHSVSRGRHVIDLSQAHAELPSFDGGSRTEFASISLGSYSGPTVRIEHLAPPLSPVDKWLAEAAAMNGEASHGHNGRGLRADRATARSPRPPAAADDAAADLLPRFLVVACRLVGLAHAPLAVQADTAVHPALTQAVLAQAELVWEYGSRLMLADLVHPDDLLWDLEAVWMYAPLAVESIGRSEIVREGSAARTLAFMPGVHVMMLNRLAQGDFSALHQQPKVHTELFRLLLAYVGQASGGGCATKAQPAGLFRP